MKKGKGVCNKGIRGVNKAFNSKTGQMAINIGAQLADMPAIRNSKYGKHLNKSLNGLNKVRDFGLFLVQIRLSMVFLYWETFCKTFEYYYTMLYANVKGYEY